MLSSRRGIRCWLPRRGFSRFSKTFSDDSDHFPSIKPHLGTFLSVLAIFMVSAASTHATPAVGLSGGDFLSAGDTGTTQSITVGWGFSVATSILVTDLGLFDGGQDGLADPHAIGIWDLSLNLLASTTIPEGAGTMLDGLFRYASITPLLLTPGNTYVIGAHYAGTTGGGSIDPEPSTALLLGIGLAGIAVRRRGSN